MPRERIDLLTLVADFSNLWRKVIYRRMKITLAALSARTTGTPRMEMKAGSMDAVRRESRRGLTISAATQQLEA
jgi:hypothetical protein